MPPVVTAIIIVLNGAEFIAEAITSIADQTWPSWELVVVDDGSTDATRSIVTTFVDRHPGRIQLVQHDDQRNHGMSASRNLGLASARGDYVAFLDADDVWLPTKLAEQVAILQTEPTTAMVYGRTLMWHSWQSPAARADYYFDLGVQPDATYPPPVLFRQLMRNRYQTPTTCNAMIRRGVVADVGGFDPEFRDLFEDQLFFAKVLLRYPTHVSDRCWARYRQHGQASSALASDAREVHRAHLRYLAALRTHLRAGGSPISARLALEAEVVKLTASAALRSARRVGRRWWCR